MRNCVCKTLPLAIAVLLISAGAGFAGDNESAVISLSTASELSGVGGGATIEVGVSAAGMTGVKQLFIQFEVDPVSAFDMGSAMIAANSTLALALPAVVSDAMIEGGAASFGAALPADADLATLTINAAADLTESVQATITVVQVQIGPSASTKDAHFPDLVVTINPPAPAPAVTAISPSEGSIAGGTAVSITGTNFADGATVTIGGAAATGVAFVDATSITAITPAGAEGAADVVVTNADAQASTLAAGFTYLGIIDPTLTASTGTDAALEYSAVGTGDADDGSAGEVTMSVSFTDASGAAAAGQDVTFSITNNGSEVVFVVGGNAQEIASGADASVVVATDAAGAASITLDAEADRQAGTTSVSVSAATTADNSEGTSFDLSVDFSAAWDVPVVAELAAFGGSTTPDSDVVLQWSVVSQTGNLGWEVFRSTDDCRYQQVGELVDGAGTSDAYLTYSFRDESAPVVDVLYYYLRQVDMDGTSSRSSVIEIRLGDAVVLPASTGLMQNYPNPFNPETTISFDVSEESIVTLRVYDLTGQVVRTLLSARGFGAGRYESVWDGRNESGVRVASGVYFYQLATDTFSSMKKMTLLQ